MISEAEFNEALGIIARNLSRQEVEKLRTLLDQLANLMFDVWQDKNNKLNEPKKL